MREIKITWSTDDIFMLADELGIELGEHEADEILELMYQNHDATIGVCWDVIGTILYQYQSDRENELKETI